MHNSRILIWLAALALVACGGGSDGSSFATVATPPVTTASTVASVLVLSDSTTIPSDNSSSAGITIYVRDANNQFLSGVSVAVTASSGALTPVVTGTAAAGVTDSSGSVKYALSTLGDKTNRTITITAKAGTITSTATVAVTGSTLAVQGPSSLTVGQTQAYTVTLNDAGAKGIAGATVSVTPPSNGTVSPASLTTDSNGRATFNLTATAGGNGTVTATGLGITTTASVTVAADALAFSTPTAGAQIALGVAQTFTVTWSTNGVPVSGQPINFATTRGCINPPSTTCVGVLSTATVVTNGAGQASVTVLSTNAGGATVTATLSNGTVASRSVQFIATTPTNIDVQPSVFTLAPNETSTISAIVRDAQNNLVANRLVTFNLSDITGGTLSQASATTDLQGRAQTVYTAGSVPSANGGVQVTASVPNSAVTPKTVALTVARRQVFISMGTGNQISEPNTAQYKKDYVVQVTDSTGVGVKGVSLSMSVLSQQYFKGLRVKGATAWTTNVTAVCADEDVNRNGVLDAGEDNNNSGLIEAGNIAAVLPASVTTDDNGFAVVSVYYPQEYAYYLKVTLQALAQVQGTAYSASSTFVLEGLSTDFSDLTTSPPGPVSAFGVDSTCADTL
jgi:hypothetical protein